MIRPRIAVNCDIQPANGATPARAFLYLPYLEWIRQAGGLPVMLPPCAGAEELLDDCHGVLFTGGDDYLCSVARDAPPPRFVQVPPERERTDLQLVDAVLDQDLPVLGICLGFQLLALAAGGTVIGDMDTELGPSDIQHRRGHPDDPLPTHDIEWLADSAVPKVTCGNYVVPSQHHQAVGELPDGWRALAQSQDGILEAAVGPGTYQVGIQWHPERELGSPLSRALAESLVAAARRRALESAQ